MGEGLGGELEHDVLKTGRWGVRRTLFFILRETTCHAMT